MKKFLVSGFEDKRDMSLQELEDIYTQSMQAISKIEEYCGKVLANHQLHHSRMINLKFHFYALCDSYKYLNSEHESFNTSYDTEEPFDERFLRDQQNTTWRKVEPTDFVNSQHANYTNTVHHMYEVRKKANNFMTDIRKGKSVVRGWLPIFTSFSSAGFPRTARILYVNRKEECDLCGYSFLPKTFKNHRNGVKCRLDSETRKARDNNYKPMYHPDVINAVSRGELPGNLAPIKVSCWAPDWIISACETYHKSQKENGVAFADMDIVEYLKLVNPNSEAGGTALAAPAAKGGEDGQANQTT